MSIPGVKQRTAEILIAETGADMSAFPSAKHLASWAGMCPGNDESAGKRRSRNFLELHALLHDGVAAAAVDQRLSNAGEAPRGTDDEVVWIGDPA
jgi:transposase